MPELPEVETVRRGLEPVLAGQRVLRVEQRRPDLRFPFPERFAERLEGRGIVSLGRRAKYLLADLDDGNVLIMHLGMSGSFRIDAAATGLSEGRYFAPGKDAAHDHVVLHLAGGASVTYNDPRRFGFMTLAERRNLPAHPLFKDLGVEPLGNEFGAERLRELFAGKSAPLKAALLDQRLIAGLGNIYVNEAMHRARLSPLRPAGALAEDTARAKAAAGRLAQSVRDVLEEALAAGGSSLRDYRQANGALGYFQHRFRVYDREGQPCPSPRCSGTIERVTQSGRSTFFCRHCQK